MRLVFIRHLVLAGLCALLVLAADPLRAQSSIEAARDSVVSVLPVWPGRAQGGADTPPGVAPEGSGVVLGDGIVATAWHVIAPADRIDLRLADGRILPAELIGHDAASDIAVLSVDAQLPIFEIAPRPDLAQPVCTIGNAWGLGLSVTCGVVSARDVSNAGFNPVEHFVQTDAPTNPGTSGGALVDSEGRLVGMMSAIFASEGETNIGVNFAVSAPLLERVVSALLETGQVRYPDPGWRLVPPGRAQLATLAAPVIAEIRPQGNAAAAGARANDIVTHIDGTRVRTPRDAEAVLALIPEATPSVPVELQRDGQSLQVALPLLPMAGAEASPGPEMLGDCPHPVPVCRMRQVVFPVSSFDPVGSATRIGPDLLVTNRHVVGDRSDAVVHTPDGPRGGRVLNSAYEGDLVLIAVDGLPKDGAVAPLGTDAATGEMTGLSYAIGADVSRQEVRVFDPGTWIAPPAEGAALARLHVTSHMQPGVSGGALVDEKGTLLGISVGGGEGRFEAIPVADVRALLDLRDSPSAGEITRARGADFTACADALSSTDPRNAPPEAVSTLTDLCARADNHGQLLEAGRALAFAGAFEEAVTLHRQAVEQVPNSVNGRVSLLVSLQLGGRFEDMTEHAEHVMALAPDDPQVLRFAIQSGVWGGKPELAEQGYAALLKADPMQAQAARRFIDNAPPAPARR